MDTSLSGDALEQAYPDKEHPTPLGVKLAGIIVVGLSACVFVALVGFGLYFSRG